MGENKKSIIAVADTHFGLNQAGESCNPKAFCDFIKWINNLKNNNKFSLKVGPWGKDEQKELDIFFPEKLILLGDIIEMWDASNEAIFASIQNCISELSKLDCQKIYILGNHDYDISDLSTKEEFSYPLGNSEITIIKNQYEIELDGSEYLFLHGQQFDQGFRLTKGFWRVMGPIRKAALALGNYTWVIVLLFVSNILLGLLRLVNFDLTTILLGSLSVPFIVQQFGRKVFNSINTSLKYKPKDARKRFDEHIDRIWKDNFYQWRLYEDRKPLTVIYGHTHAIDTQEEHQEDEYGNDKVVLNIYNLPSWVCNSPNSKKEEMKKELSDVFLYIDQTIGPIFVGWDKTKEKPYYIPRDIVGMKRKNGNLSTYKFENNGIVVNASNLKDHLRKIDWPKESIKKWVD